MQVGGKPLTAPCVRFVRLLIKLVFLSSNYAHSSMPEDKNDIIRQLRQVILPLEGFRPAGSGRPVGLDLGAIEGAFPNGLFPIGAMHEFTAWQEEEAAAACAFLAVVLGQLMASGGIAVWIGSPGATLAAGLAYYGVDPDRVIFVTPDTTKKALWVMEEALRCEGFIAVVGEITELNFFQSRRLQLVAEQSRVTGLLLRVRPRQRHPIAAVAQWRITPLPTRSQGDRPGRGFPRWRVELLKVRHRQPFSCEVEWTGEKITVITGQADDQAAPESKTG